MFDKIGTYLNPKDIKLIPQSQAEKRHHYLFGHSIEGAPYHHDKNEYFPTIRNTPYGIYWESCPAKVLFGHNLYEISEQDCMLFIEKSVAQLAYAGIHITPERLIKQKLSRLDVNKLVICSPGINISKYLFDSAKSSGRFQQGISYYPNNGLCCFNNLKHRKLKFYDKIREAQAMQDIPKELQEIFQNQQCSVLNVEFQMHKAEEIKREYKKHNLDVSNTVESAFMSEVSKTILLNRVKNFLENTAFIDAPIQLLIPSLKEYCNRYNIHGGQAILAIFSLIMLVNNLGTNIAYQTLDLLNRNSRYKYWNEIKKIDSFLKETDHLLYGKESIELQEAILSSIKQMNPIRLQDYQSFSCKSIESYTQCVGNTTSNTTLNGGLFNETTFSKC